MGRESSTQRGWESKSSCPRSKVVFLGFRRDESGMSQEFFAGISRTLGGCVQKVYAKKGHAHFSFPTITNRTCYYFV